jgi:hypothetical protein
MLMSDKCTVYIPLHLFPGREQLIPLCPGAEVQVDAPAQRAAIVWPDLHIQLSRDA